METIKYDNPEQIEVVKAELAKLSANDKALFAAKSLEMTINNIKADGWKAYAFKVAKVIIPLGIGILVAQYVPQLNGILGAISNFAG